MPVDAYSPAGTAAIPAMISHAVGLAKLKVQPAPKRLPTIPRAPCGCRCRQGRLHPLLPPRQAVRPREELQVLGDRQPAVQARSFRHDRDALPDFSRTAGLNGMPATIADPAVGSISVPRIRTVVVSPTP
jgi:hypothetical protein